MHLLPDTPLTPEQAALVSENLDLAKNIAWEKSRTANNILREEIHGWAQDGLIKAASKFDPAKGKFRTYAARVIKGAIADGQRTRLPYSRHAHDLARAMIAKYPPRDIPVVIRKITKHTLRAQLYTAVNKVLNNVAVHVSLDDKDHEPIVLKMPQLNPEQEMLKREAEFILNESLDVCLSGANLLEKHRNILNFWIDTKSGEEEEMQQKEIGKIFGVSSDTVSSVVKDAKTHLQAYPALQNLLVESIGRWQKPDSKIGKGDKPNLNFMPAGRSAPPSGPVHAPS